MWKLYRNYVDAAFEAPNNPREAELRCLDPSNRHGPIGPLAGIRSPGLNHKQLTLYRRTANITQKYSCGICDSLAMLGMGAPRTVAWKACAVEAQGSGFQP